MAKFDSRPEVVGYKLGAIPMHLVAGTTDELETAQSVQGQPYALLRVWQPSSLSYVTLTADASGNLNTAGGAASTAGGSTTVDATLLASTAMVGHVIIDSMPAGGSGLTDAELRATDVAMVLSSAGSTRVVGTVNQGTAGASPWLAAISSGAILGVSTAVIGHVIVDSGASGTTSVDANLTSAGSTKVIGTVGVSSGLVLGPSTAAIGLISSGSQTIGTVINTSGMINGASTAVIGLVSQGSGSSANAWFSQSIAFSSANVARTTVNTSVDVQVIAANANRKALIIASLSTAQTVAIGLTTAVMTTALANVSLYLTANSYILLGLSGGLPIYQGPIRAINITSTAVAGGVALSEFT